MPTIRVEPGKLGITLRADARNLRKVLKRGAKRGAQRARTHLVRTSPVDRGVLKNAWQVMQGGGELFEIEVVNTAPYAGVVERGMRPGFKMSHEGLVAIAGWVKRKILKNPQPRGPRGRAGTLAASLRAGLTGSIDAQAMAIARRIATKFEREGRVGKFFVRDSIGKITVFALEEIMREVNKYFSSGGGTRGNV